MIDRNVTPAMREAEHRRKLEREEEERRLSARLRERYFQTYPNATEQAWRSARPGLIQAVRDAQMQAHVQEIANDVAPDERDQWLGGTR